MSGSSAEAGVARDAIVTALHLGVPLCNDGEFEQATQVYKNVATIYAAQDRRLSDAVEASKSASAAAAGWIYRHAFDSVLATEARTEGMLIFDIPLEPAPAVTAPAPAGRSTAIAAPAAPAPTDGDGADDAIDTAAPAVTTDSAAAVAGTDVNNSDTNSDGAAAVRAGPVHPPTVATMAMYTKFLGLNEADKHTEMLFAIEAAIEMGAPLWNHGDFVACTGIYRTIAERYDHTLLAEALSEGMVLPVDKAGWLIRRAFDLIIAADHGEGRKAPDSSAAARAQRISTKSPGPVVYMNTGVHRHEYAEIDYSTMNGQKSPDYALPNELPTPIAEPTVSTYELPTPIAEPTKYPPSPETAPAEYEDFGLATKPPSFVPYSVFDSAVDSARLNGGVGAGLAVAEQELVATTPLYAIIPEIEVWPGSPDHRLRKQQLNWRPIDVALP